MKVSAQASHGTCSMGILGWEKSDRGAYGRLSADFSADQQDTSAIVQIAGTSQGYGHSRSLWLVRRSL